MAQTYLELSSSSPKRQTPSPSNLFPVASEETGDDDNETAAPLPVPREQSTDWRQWLSQKGEHFRDLGILILNLGVILFLAFINRNLEHVLDCIMGTDGSGGVKMAPPISILASPASNCSSRLFPTPSGDVLRADVCQRQAHPAVDLYLNQNPLRSI